MGSVNWPHDRVCKRAGSRFWFLSFLAWLRLLLCSRYLPTIYEARAWFEMRSAGPYTVCAGLSLKRGRMSLDEVFNTRWRLRSRAVIDQIVSQYAATIPVPQLRTAIDRDADKYKMTLPPFAPDTHRGALNRSATGGGFAKRYARPRDVHSDQNATSRSGLFVAGYYGGAA